MTRRSILVVALAAAALVALARFAAAPIDADEPVEFPHSVHVTDYEVECAACHDTGGPGKPKLSTEGCLECHEDGPPAYVLSTRARRLDIAFPHQRHAKAIDCTACHNATVTDTAVAGKPILERETCLRCHKARDVAVPETACRRCHGVDRRLVRPANHDGTWRAQHGSDARWRQAFSFGHGKDCVECHGTSSCRACHDQMTPQSHTGLWRVRTHGFSAEWDRDRCKTCHETGTCIRCHTTTAPMNHTGAWRSTHPLTAGSVGGGNCGECHRTSFCIDCHEGR